MVTDGSKWTNEVPAIKDVKELKSSESRTFQSSIRLIATLQDCAKNKDLQRGIGVHIKVLQRGLLTTNRAICSTLINMYAKCGALEKAREVLDGFPVRDVYSWSPLIAGYAQSAYGKEALNCFEQMLDEGISADAVMFVCTLTACGSTGALDKGEKIHSEIARQGLLSEHVILGGALVDMYAKCGALAKAKKVLDGLRIKNAVSWSALITGHARRGNGKEALECYEKMLQGGLYPSSITFTCILKACGCIGAIDKGIRIHSEIARQGLLDKHIILGNALIDMYAKCGAFATAKEVLLGLPNRNAISWNALIAGYVEEDYGEEALNCFEQMQREGLSPSAATFACVLKACGSIGALDKGEEIHLQIVREELLDRYVSLCSALVDMYAKCGSLSKARVAHETLHARNVVSWFALIAGYAQGGRCAEALSCFDQMQREGLCPNDITFLCVLSACSHSGLMGRGQTYFIKLSIEYGVLPSAVHLTCMVDLFARLGCLEKAIAVIEKVPLCKYFPLWSAFLTACGKWGNETLGKWAFEYAVQSDVNGASSSCIRESNQHM